MARAQQAVGTCQSSAQFRQIANDLLASLKASHTYYMTADDWEYYHLAAVFESLPIIQELFSGQPIRYPSIGVIVQADTTGGDEGAAEWIVADVLPGSAAEAGGLQLGDILLKTADQPYTPVASLRGREGQATELTVRRGGDRLRLTITPQRVHPQAELLAALQASIKVVEIEGRQVGYVHFYSYAGRQYHEVLEEAIATGPLREAEALVIDLRYGLGGADPSYLNLFNRQIPELRSVDRAGDTHLFHPVWRKPTVFLVNETSRSGKEVLAFAAKKHRLATLVGTRTAGAVLAGSPVVIDGVDLLYLAVRDVSVDGVRLEGIGVQPDVEVHQDRSAHAGRDLQREAALRQAAGLLNDAPPTPEPSQEP
jgi:carboxyl-terminal processing protease